MNPTDCLTDRNFWARYWKDYRPRPVASRLHYDNYLSFVAEGSRFVEIGGFPGEHALRFWKLRGCGVTLLDFYIDRQIVDDLERVNGAPKGTIQTKEADFFACSEGSHFDVVFSDGFIEHFEDTAAVVSRHVDMLAPGGVLLLIVPNLRGINGWIQKLFDPANLAIHNLESMKPQTLRAIMASLPLTNCEVVYSGRPMVWLEKRKGLFARVSGVLVKLFSLALKIFPFKNRFFSPYLILFARKV